MGLNGNREVVLRFLKEYCPERLVAMTPGEVNVYVDDLAERSSTLFRDVELLLESDASFRAKEKQTQK